MRDYEEKSYYEIQLDNKQLILVFLAGVTVCVLVFILGVMVGKGKKEAEMVSASRNEITPVKPQPDLSQPQEIQPAAEQAKTPADQGTHKNKKGEPAGQQQVAATQPSKGDGMVYDDLDKTDKEAPLTPKPQPAAPAKQTTADALKDVASKTQEPPAETAPPDNNASKNGGTRYTVQVMATGSKEKAEQQLNYLKSKGYTAFMSEETTGSGSNVYKVRVGKFADSESAKKIATRLKEELKLETWVAVLE
ncbi:MAG TPA: SPOR domain-containing protein [Acidobacteriota bacterium]|nr:SPOR domain-containing protein [Acidobacteriota bacterium]